MWPWGRGEGGWWKMCCGLCDSEEGKAEEKKEGF